MSEGEERRGSVQERLGSSFLAVKEKAAAAIEAIKPAVQAASEKALPVAQSAADSVRRGSVAAAQAATDKFHESGLDSKLEKVNTKVGEAAQKAGQKAQTWATAHGMKNIEESAKSSIKIFQKGVSAQASQLASALKSADFVPDAHGVAVNIGPKPTTMTGIRFSSGLAVASFCRTDTVAAIEGLFNASDRPTGRVLAWKYEGENFIQTCEVVLPVGATSVEVISEPSTIVLIGREDGTLQVFSVTAEGVLNNDYSIKVHHSSILSLTHVSNWSQSAAAADGAAHNSNVIVLSSSADGSVRVIDLTERSVVHHIELSSAVPAVAPVSRSCVAFGSAHGQLVSMDFSPALPAAPIATADFPTAHRDGIATMAWDSVSNQFWTAGADNLIVQWRVGDDNATPVFGERYYGHTSPVRRMLWCGEAGAGGVLVSGDASGRILLWPRSNPNLHASIHAHSKAVAALGWWPSTNRLISASEDGTIRLWDISRIVAGERFNAAEVALQKQEQASAATAQQQQQQQQFSPNEVPPTEQRRMSLQEALEATETAETSE